MEEEEENKDKTQWLPSSNSHDTEESFSQGGAGIGM
jgi:hypothetical protein